VESLSQTQLAMLASDFCGMRFDTPLVLLSGCVGFGEEYTRVKGFSNRDVGAVCLKGTTLAPRLGNQPHRVMETPAGMLNAIGLQNPGSRHVVEKILPTLDFSETRFIANLSGSTIEEYAEDTRIFHDSHIDAMEINISCANVKEGGVQFGNEPDMSARVSFLSRAMDEAQLQEKPKTIVPGSALVDRGGSKVLFVLEDGTVRMRNVTVGPEIGGGFEVMDGPSAGTRVVANPPETLVDGQRVKEKS